MLSSQSIIGAKRSDGTEREINDFYASDPIVISELRKFVDIQGSVWECACGNGNLSKELLKIKKVFHVFSSDLIYRGYECSIFDYLKYTNSFPMYTWIVTNPPYKHGLEFAKKALKDASNVAFLMKLSWLESIKRKAFFKKNPPSKVLVYSKRPGIYKNDIKTKNTGLIAFAWFVWEQERDNKDTIIKWI